MPGRRPLSASTLHVQVVIASSQRVAGRPARTACKCYVKPAAHTNTTLLLNKAIIAITKHVIHLNIVEHCKQAYLRPSEAPVRWSDPAESVSGLVNMI
jgi:hypothetical protein